MSADYDDEPPLRDRRRAASVLGDRSTRPLVYGALGIGAVLVLGIGGWSLLGGHHGGIPVLGPPPGPVKVKPANPGGMQIVDQQGGDSDATGHGDAHLAPDPEQPNPNALARRYGQEEPAPAAPPAVSSPSADHAAAAGKQDGDQGGAAVPAGSGQPSDPKAAGGAGSAVGASSSASGAAAGSASERTHGPGQGTVAPHEVAPVEKVASEPDRPDVAPETKGGAYKVQLAALETEGQARQEWERLSHKAGGALFGQAPIIEPVMHGGKTLYRLRTGGFASVQAARAFCVKLRAAQIACTPAQF